MIGESEEQQRRDKAFYLLKKHTSYTYLAHAVQCYKTFVDACGIVSRLDQILFNYSSTSYAFLLDG